MIHISEKATLFKTVYNTNFIVCPMLKTCCSRHVVQYRIKLFGIWYILKAKIVSEQKKSPIPNRIAKGWHNCLQERLHTQTAMMGWCITPQLSAPRFDSRVHWLHGLLQFLFPGVSTEGECDWWMMFASPKFPTSFCTHDWGASPIQCVMPGTGLVCF